MESSQPIDMKDERAARSPSAIVLELSLFSKFLNEADETEELHAIPAVVNKGKSPVVEQQHLKHTLSRSHCIGQIQFIISCVGFSVGLGNIWRFPYLCYLYGGGSFLIAYTAMMLCVGLPLFALEVSLGQYSGKSSILLYSSICPLLRGLGPAMMLISLFVLIYYNILLAWIFYYMFMSFSKELPWAKCSASWSKKECYSIAQINECESRNSTFWNMSCFSAADVCQILGYVVTNTSHCISESGNHTSVISHMVALTNVTQRISSTEDYFWNYALSVSTEISGLGSIQWQLALCLILAWIFLFLCLMRGTYSSGHIVYCTASLSCLVLVILLVRCAFLDGALSGILYYVTPNFDSLLNPKLWGDAAVQVLFSLGATFGVLITLSSYSRFNNNCIRDAIIVVLCDSVSSLLAGFVAFAVIGYMATQLNVPMKAVIKPERSLAFVTYPEAIITMGISPLWSFLFFALLLCVGLDCQYTALESIRTAIEDAVPKLRKFRVAVLLVICCVCCCLGLSMTTRAGMYIFAIIDEYATCWAVLIIGFLNCLLVTRIYGNCGRKDANIKTHIEEMIRLKVSPIWIAYWRYITPGILLLLLIWQWTVRTRPPKSRPLLPGWLEIIHWLLICTPISLILIFAAHAIYVAIRRKEPLKTVLIPTEEWGPANDLTGSAFSVNSCFQQH